MGKGRTKQTYTKNPVIKLTISEDETGKPTMPSHLGPIAKKEFRRLAKLLGDEANEADGIALGILCQAYEHWVKAEENLANEGFTVAGPNGMMRANPNMAISVEAIKTVERIGRDFGLTPLSRKKLVKADPEDKPVANEFADWQAKDNIA